MEFYFKANILINDLGNACLADFGISRIFDVKGFTTKNTSGTYRWMSIELLKEEMYKSESVANSRTTMEADIWAFGMTSLEVRIQAVSHALSLDLNSFIYHTDIDRSDTVL